MKEFLLTLIALSLSGSVLAVLLLAVHRMLGRRLPRAFWYYAWLLVLLRLVVPLGYGVQLPQVAQPAGEDTQQETALPLSPQQNEQEFSSSGRDVPADLPATSPDPVPDSTAPAFALADGLFLLWAVGAAGFFLRHLVSYLWFARQVRQTLCPPPAEALALFEPLRAGRRVGLAVSGQVDIPMLMGVLRPVVVLPKNGPVLQDRNLSAVLSHELTHYKRGDVLYKWLVVLVTAFHWFNPLVHWLGRRIALDCELSCDQAVLAALPQKERIGYGELLLALAAGGRLPTGVTATTLCEEKRQLKARLQGILGYHKPTKGTFWGALALGLLLTCCACGVLDLAGTPEAAVFSSTAVEPEMAVRDPYADLLARYQEALSQRQPDDYPDLPEILTNPYWAWADTDSLLDRTGYAEMDLDGDGLSELLLGWLGNDIWNLNQGYVFAIYTLVEGQPVLAVEGWERSLYVLGEDGYLYHCSSSGAEQTEWNKYRFNPAAENDLETVEHISVPENGQEAVKTGEAWMASGISIPYCPFAPAEVKDVLLGNTSFFYWPEGAETPESKVIAQVPALFSPHSDYAVIHQFAVLDLDSDGKVEAVLQISDVANDMGGYLVLRQVGDRIYGYPSNWRTFWYLKTDGTFIYSSPTGNEEGVATVRFTEIGMELDKHICAQGNQFEFDTFLVDGASVSQEVYENARDLQSQKPDAVWLPWNESSIRALT